MGEIAVNSTRIYAQSTRRDKAELRAVMQESVHEFTRLKRERLLPELRKSRPDLDEVALMALLDATQPAYEEYDPVVQLAVMAADHSNSAELRKSAAAEAAQYVRPKLKSIEMTVDPLSAEQQAERAVLAGRLVGLLTAAADAKRSIELEPEAVRDVTRPA